MNGLKIFQEQLDNYLTMPEDGRMWLGGIYTHKECKINFELDSFGDLLGSRGEFHLYSVGGLLESHLDENEFYELFEFNIDETRKFYLNKR